jgi:hypothetical protein
VDQTELDEEERYEQIEVFAMKRLKGVRGVS